MTTEFSHYRAAQAQLDRIAELMGLEEPLRELLRSPMHEHRLLLPVKMDDGQTRVIRAFRVRHNDARGPCWGGVRFHPLNNVDTVRAMAMWMSWKTALIDLPLGGSMGWVVCDPHTLTSSELERVCRTYVRRLSQELGPHKDVPAPDIMTAAQHMTWMLDELETLAGEHSPGSITGKPAAVGGSRGRPRATGYGLIYTVREALRVLGVDPNKTSASIQGFGSVGRHAADLYQKIGGTIVCVAALDQTRREPMSFVKPDGWDPEELATITDRFGSIDRDRAEKLGCEVLDGDAWLEQDVEILIPAAIEDQITADNVDRISRRVRLVAEGANGPTTEAAEKTMIERGIYVIPDLLANAGGVVCSYLEQVQSSMNYYWRLSEVLSKLDLTLTDAFVETADLAQDKGLTLRDAAMVIAVDRVASVCRQRGWA